MSDEPDEINKYIRINRAELISDVNMSLGGSLSLSATNPIQQSDGAYLDSRVGGSDRLPTPGYVLKFDSTNPSAFIQTVIPSSERDNYNITIKGEGTIDVLYVDTTGTNIAIKQKQSLTGSDYFDLSYIAFVDRTSGNITHLFECEESDGLYLYDAVAGDAAFLTINGTEAYADSLSTMRLTATSKEWIRNESENLGNEVDFVSGYASKASFTQNIPDELSICFELENNINLVNIASTTPLIQIQTGGLGASTNTGISFEVYDRTEYIDKRLYLYIRTTSGASNYNTYKRVVELFDGNKHKFAFILSKTNKNIKIAVDGTVNNNYTFTPSASFNWNTFDNATRTINISNSAYKANWENIKFFNFDISANDAPYTLQDYQNGKDVPSNLISGLDVIPTTIGTSNWLEEKGKLSPATNTSLSYNNEIWTYTKSTDSNLSNAWSRYWFQNYVISGSSIEISIGTRISHSTNGSVYLNYIRLEYTDGTVSGNSYVESDNISIKLIASKRVKAIGFSIGSNSTALTGDYLEVTGLKIKVNGTLLNLNNATSTTLLDSSLNNNSLTLSGTTELPNKNYGTWCNAVGATFNRLVLWDKGYSADTTTTYPSWGCWSSNWPAWSRNNISSDQFNNSLVGNSLRITAVSDWTNYGYNIYLGTLDTASNTSLFKFKTSKLYFNFDSISVRIKSLSDTPFTGSGVKLGAYLIYVKRDGTLVDTASPSSIGAKYFTNGGVIDTSTLDDFDYIVGVIIRPDCYSLSPVGSKNFIAGDYFEIENFSIVAEDAEILNNGYSSTYNPLPMTLPRKVLV